MVGCCFDWIMAKNFLIWGIVIALLIVGIGYVKVVQPATANHDQLAKCLASNGATMYGAYWCPHCEAQQEMFGKSKRYLPYVECAIRGSSDITQICKDEGIESYPTWKFNSGEVAKGRQSFEQLAQLSNCAA